MFRIGVIMTKSQSRVNGLSSVRHTGRTYSIMFTELKVENESDFIRKAIVYFAQENGFGDKPVTLPSYIDIDRWTKIRSLDLKSFMQKNGKMIKSRGDRGVDYTYLYAFEFLRSLAEFKHVGTAKLQRLAIIDYGVMMLIKEN